VPVLQELSEDALQTFDLVSITSPTVTHFNLLKKLMKIKTPVIICEKPVSADVHELDQLMSLYNQGQSRILVNYIRRFQPAFEELKNLLLKWDNETGLKSIIIKYQRGFLNNASHAIDLLEFLFNEPFLLKDFKISDKQFDSFDFDATLTASCTYKNQPVSFAGVAGADYAIFEIELFYSSSKIVICHSGNDIRYYKRTVEKQLSEETSLRKENTLKQYMIPVVNKAIALMKNNAADNFLSSAEMNKRILKAVVN
jgi:predicted dehydrogenase